MPNQENFGKEKALTVFTLTMINVAAIQSLRNLAVMASLGWASILFWAAAALFFFIPASLAAAELAGAWPSRGGIYTWVRAAFGERWGFAAIFLQWAENVIWYPTILSFSAATLAFAIDPELADSPLFIIPTVLLIFWGCTLFDALGMKAAGSLSTIGVLLGTLLPATLILILGFGWVMSGHPSAIPFSIEKLLPEEGSFQSFVFLTGVMLAFGGIEMPAVHANEIEHPRRSYPRAIFFSTALILFFSIFGTLAIALVVPEGMLNLVSGVMQAFTTFFDKWGLKSLVPFFALMIAFGSIATVATWIVGPSKGLLFAAEQGNLPPLFAKKTARGMPSFILLFQGILVTLLSLIFVLMPTVSSAFWALTALTAILYLMMYVLMFMAVFVLRVKEPGRERRYKIPGGLLGVGVVAGVGVLAALSAIGTGFIPPKIVPVESLWLFELILGGGALTLFLLPHIIFKKN